MEKRSILIKLLALGCETNFVLGNEALNLEKNPIRTLCLFRKIFRLTIVARHSMNNPFIRMNVSPMLFYRFEGMPGWRRRNVFSQAFELLRMGLMYPIYCISYMISPTSERGTFLKNPFVKVRPSLYCSKLFRS